MVRDAYQFQRTIDIIRSPILWKEDPRRLPIRYHSLLILQKEPSQTPHPNHQTDIRYRPLNQPQQILLLPETRNEITRSHYPNFQECRGIYDGRGYQRNSPSN